MAEQERLNKEMAAEASAAAHEVIDLRQRLSNTAESLAEKEAELHDLRQKSTAEAEVRSTENLHLRGLLQESLVSCWAVL